MKKLLIILIAFVLNTQILVATQPCDCIVYASATSRTQYGYNVGTGLDCCDAEPGPVGTYLEEVWDNVEQKWVPVTGGPITGTAAQAPCCPVG